MNKKIILANFFVLFLVANINLICANTLSFLSPTPQNNSIISEDFILFNLSFFGINSPNVSLITVELYDQNNNFISSINTRNYIATGTFNSLEDGYYYLYATAILQNGTKYQSEQRYFNINKTLSIDFADPTNLNNSLITMINPLIIKVKTNKNLTDFIGVYIFNEEGKIINSLNITNSSDFYYVYNLSDGNYSFSANASLGNLSAFTPLRFVQVRATPPSISNLSFLPNLPSSVFLGELNLTLLLNFSPSVLPVFVSIIAESENETKIRMGRGQQINDSFVFPVNFNLTNITSEGRYSFYLYVRDTYGNFAKFLLGFMNVSSRSKSNPQNTVGEDILNTGGGGGGGSASSWKVIYTNKTNNTAISKERINELKNLSETFLNKTSNEINNNKERSFFSAIPGAVTGLLSDPSKITLVIVFIIALAYLLLKSKMIKKRKLEQEEADKKKKKNNNSIAREESN